MKKTIYQAVIFAGLIAVLTILLAEWLYGSITWREDNIVIRTLETIIFLWATGYWFVGTHRGMEK